jgi:predicted metal-binding membrane protein
VPARAVSRNLGVAVVLAWALLGLWLASSLRDYMGHGPSVGGLPAAAAFAVGWALMVLAMMVPSASKLVHLFQRVVGRRADAGRLVTLLVLGFIVIWTAIGLAFQGFDRQIHAAVDASPWLTTHQRIVAAAALVSAGGFQFTSLKHRCLTACRNPRSFIMVGWQGAHPRREAIRIGIRYGWSCVGCCWALMLLLFALGLSSLAWMFAMGAYTAVEKNTAVGPSLARPVGAALLVAGAAVALA